MTFRQVAQLVCAPRPGFFRKTDEVFNVPEDDSFRH